MREKILIFDVPASTGGALTILNQYYEKATKDKEKDYVFIISTPKLKNTSNIKVINFPWVKKSWFHRLYFDSILTKKIVEEEKPTEILSLQNTYIKNKKKLFQTIYVHQPLPFTPIKMSFIKDTKLWIYQNIIGNVIKRSIKKANKIIVQTNWMKETIIKETKIKQDDIIIKQPILNLPEGYKHVENNNNLFFYPASANKYKNHKIIIEAAKLLKKDNIDNYKIELTLTGKENKHVLKLKKECKNYNLPINFIGKLGYEKVMQKYSKSTLIFPSYIETFGLPLLEARTIGSPIIASDTPFSREIGEGYSNIKYFDYKDIDELYKNLKESIVEVN